jgi:DNA repair protein RadB
VTVLNRLPLGCQSLDRLLGGGFESGIITQIYGEGGTGKTNIVIQLAIQTVCRGLYTVFIDTEGFSPVRFEQIAGIGAKEIASKVLIYEPLSLEQQHTSIHEIAKIAGNNIGVIILDSATSLYRALLESDDNRSIRRSLYVQLGELQEISRRHMIPVVITNQVYTDVETQKLKPLGGTYLEHACKAIMALEKMGDGRRRARIIKHRSQPEGEFADFIITSKGVE